MYFDLSGQFLNDNFANWESETAALLKFITFIKTVEDHDKFFLIDAFTAIFYIYVYFIMFSVNFTSQRYISFWSKLISVIQEIGDNLNESFTIYIYGQI